ncbi:hypothetical protein A9Q99_18595 [Gammaproteobacteria bacterium 45_16_T64]|nr:hypothetical protein A9Q99_18595 [Gammaproteobacteria bacterium 45_16_T64]
MLGKIDFQQVVDDLDYGVITLDDQLRVLYFNRWMFEVSGKQPDQVLNIPIERVFPQISNSRFVDACRDAIDLRLPTRLSNSFNPSPLPLYQNKCIGDELYRLQQATVIKPSTDNEGSILCEIYVQDVTPIVSKETLLKQMAADHEKLAKQFEEEKDHLSRIINNTADAIITFERGNKIQMCNLTGVKLFGYSQEELNELHFEDLLQPPESSSPHSSEKLRSLLDNAISNGVTSHHAIATYAYRKDGVELPIQIKFSRTSVSDQPLIVAIVRDTSDQASRDKILKESEARFRNLAKIAPVGIFQTDENGVLNYTNQTWNIVTGQPRNTINEDLWFDHVADEDREGVESQWKVETANNEQFVLEYSFVCEDKLKWVLCQLMEELDENGRVLGYVGSITDISEQRKTQAKIEHLAFYDPLTSLANRRLFKDRLARSIAALKRGKKRMALLSLDLDEFKRVNDSLGHDAGDQLLTTIADRLSETVREEDTVARLGGDEFSIILNDIERSSDAAIVAQKVIDAVTKSISLGQQSITMTVSIGITIAPDDGREPAELVKNADMAMYSVKEVNKNSFNFFSASMNKKASDRLSLENDIRGAVLNKEFFVKYQPQLDIDSGNIIGAEALARWNHDVRGMVPPCDFIPVAESSNLILSLGELMLYDACKGANRLINRLGNPKDFTLAVNLSAKQLMDKKLVHTIQKAVQTAGIYPEQLELEITESALMQNIGEAVKVLNSLKGYGVKIAIDDFGTGYSSLSYLRTLPVDRLKIDQSFIFDLMNNQRDKDLVTAIVAMAHSLKMEVIAEGIETFDQWQFLKSLQCDFGQGYYISKPTGVNEIVKACDSYIWSAVAEGRQNIILPEESPKLKQVKR